MKKILSLILALSVVFVLSLLVGCTNPATSGSGTTATVTVASQSGPITSGTAGSVTFAVITSDVTAGTAGTFTWYTTPAGTTATTAPKGITATVTPIASNTAKANITATAYVVAGSYYFTLTEASAVSALATFSSNIGEPYLMGGAIQGKKLSLTTAVSLFAGAPSGSSGDLNGNGTSALFSCPTWITTDGTNLYVSDSANSDIRKIVIATGAVSLLAGSSTGASGTTNSTTGTSALFNWPEGITTDSTNLYVADGGNNEIRQIVIATGAVSLLAGLPTGGSGNSNSTTGTSALFTGPEGITTDGTYLYVADTGNNEIRRIVIATGAVTLFAGSPTGGSGNTNSTTGTSALFNNPEGITTDGTNLYVADGGNNEIRQIVIATGAVSLLAGSPINASGNGNSITGTSAWFHTPDGITTDDTNLYVADWNNNEVRQIAIATGAVSLLVGSATRAIGNTNSTTGTSATFDAPVAITTDGASLYVTEQLNNDIRRIK